MEVDVLEDLLPVMRGHDAYWFAKNYPGPYLIRRRTEEEIRSGPSRAIGLTCLPGQMRAVDPQNAAEALADLDAEANVLELFQAYPISKSNRNVFTNGVTLGRAQNNDVVVPLASISKFHAWIRNEAGVFVVYDARSRFGTFVNGHKAPSEGDRGLALKTGAELKLGEVAMSFMDPVSFHRWAVEQLAQQAKR
jgi:pSer/pThr/pTyr-binding forkhead associated (FHA) protein